MLVELFRNVLEALVLELFKNMKLILNIINNLLLILENAVTKCIFISCIREKMIFH